MSRPELLKLLKEKNPKINQSELKNIIDIFCSSIENALTKGQKIELRDFGSFFIKKIKEKKYARNPKTGQIIYVEEKNKVRFRAGKKLKKEINR